MATAAACSPDRCLEPDSLRLADIQTFLSEALTPDLRRAGRETIGVHSDIRACRIWHHRLFRRGWITPAWPVAFGGTGWTPAERMMFERACAENDAPVLFAGGIRTLGPLLIARGSPAQQQRYLPAIRDGSDLWCQGFSETGAGSDLAALQSRAERVGDHYKINGSKIWTTGAHLANRMFALMRTGRSGAPQNGMTFLLIDMAAPGITVKPIVSLAGEHEFNEVAFDDVLVPVEHAVGEENDGWSVAKHLMSVARSNNTTSGLLRRAMRRLRETVVAHDHKMRASELECELRSFEALELRIMSQPGEMTSMQSSMLKTLATELHQAITTATVDATEQTASLLATNAFMDDKVSVLRKYLATRAASIYSGTNETHRNLIARSLLAL